MNQHPVPQNVSSYQFRLVGDMTLKQFGLLASGAIVGFIIYQLPIHPLLRWPLIFISAFSGFALAFIPIEDRPLDRWLAAFLHSVYSPTWFFWKKTPLIPAYFLFRPAPLPPTPPETARDLTQLHEFLTTLPSSTPASVIDTRELTLLDKISQLFSTIHPPSLSITPLTDILPPPPKLPPVRVRELGLRPPARGEIRITTPTPRLSSTPSEPVAPQTPFVEFKPLLFTKKDFADLSVRQADLPLATSQTTSTTGVVQPATTPRHLPFPPPPEYPNLIVGMVVDKYDRLIDTAIIEIRDANHHPVRAVKTNKLGQFSIASPLPNGSYQLQAEKDGYQFGILSLELTGKIVDPVELRALNEGPTPTIR
ncbi:MAG: hypothetical protein A2784_00060 [Candidatus Chisholmbacteria bacterium RIFCSPHIGHO2_01_FULL_48_12]|uniref:Uncharacterized protein n=1 Tax=Candidatus Chisholmbacteria bacterium RIFCSPHIGHO2_01_FULL_48_12 TaxID=1797589 RepID=A0A1G1VKJ6_9BACT|nr:MAG: hypothetical protein A2784_00060 [Candidatus Chisholmbacteria bacterium RIFCSPHIGHO2_01_FULL_48_12]